MAVLRPQVMEAEPGVAREMGRGSCSRVTRGGNDGPWWLIGRWVIMERTIRGALDAALA